MFHLRHLVLVFNDKLEVLELRHHQEMQGRVFDFKVGDLRQYGERTR
jgi:hypothetical protein